MEDVLNYRDWPFVSIHCIDAIQYSDNNVILPRLAMPILQRYLLSMYWCVLSCLTTLSWPVFFHSATTIIAECSYFLWKEKPSASSAPFKVAIQKFNMLADLKKIKTVIEEASHLKPKDKKHVLVNIALENCLCEFLHAEVIEPFSLLYFFSFIRVQAFFLNLINIIYVQGGTGIKIPDQGTVGWFSCQAANFFLMYQIFSTKGLRHCLNHLQDASTWIYWVYLHIEAYKIR